MYHHGLTLIYYTICIRSISFITMTMVIYSSGDREITLHQYLDVSPRSSFHPSQVRPGFLPTFQWQWTFQRLALCHHNQGWGWCLPVDKPCRLVQRPFMTLVMLRILLEPDLRLSQRLPDPALRSGGGLSLLQQWIHHSQAVCGNTVHGDRGSIKNAI